MISTRGEAHIDDEYCDVTNPQYNQFVLCLDYDVFTYKQPADMAKSVSFVRRRLVQAFPYFANIEFDEEQTIERLEEMARVMEQMNGEKFGKMDQKFGIHGHKKFGASATAAGANAVGDANSQDNPVGVVKQKLRRTRKVEDGNILVNESGG